MEGLAVIVYLLLWGLVIWANVENLHNKCDKSNCDSCPFPCKGHDK